MTLTLKTTITILITIIILKWTAQKWEISH